MIKIKEKMKKLVALFTCIFFLFTTLFSNISYANIKTDNMLEFTEKEEFLSPVLGKITSSKYYDSDEIVINIQDLHCHAQTQRQISSIIELLERKYQIKGVYLEGTYKDVNTSWLSGFNDGKNGSAIIEKMVDEGRLSGTEYYSLMNNKKDFIKPIEDEQLYKENIKLLNEIIVNNQEVEIICNELEEQIKKIKNSYSSDKARKFDKLTKDFKAKKIDSKKYYQELAKFAKEKNIDVTKYSNVALYIRLMDNNASLNESKIGGELSRFLVEIKNKLPYQEYVNLVKKSNNFSKIENITNQLIKLNNQYQITKNLKLKNLESFINYLDFNDKINPISFIEEEKALKEEIFLKLGRTKYEQEVAFLNDFISNIKEYFTANISAQEYHKFEKEYKKFRTIWPSYFSVNTVKKLDKYQDLLSKYHSNNIKRDYEFAKRLITKGNEKGSLIVKETKLAVEEIEKNIKNKKVKVVVTGGFHTKGLEKILENKKISYAIITPKITDSIEKAKEIYWNTIIYNATILKNTINLEPVFQETINVSFPKIMVSIFDVVRTEFKDENTKENIQKAIEDFVYQKIIQQQNKSNDSIEIEAFTIKEITKDKIIYTVKYKNILNNGTTEREYVCSNGKTDTFTKIDVKEMKQMIDEINRPFSRPTIELEPSNNAKNEIKQYIIDSLKSVTGSFVEYIDHNQLHMTVGYNIDFEGDEVIKEKKEKAGKHTDVLTEIEKLGEKYLQQTTLEGSLKLLPNGMIIYEIKDSQLIKQMYELRDSLAKNGGYETPNSVYIMIGRITDESLLEDTSQSRQKLAELTENINKKIYEINLADKLSKIKTRCNIKGATTRDYIVERILSKIVPLVTLKKFLQSENEKWNLFKVTVLYPIGEELLFRILPSIPLVLTSFAITTNPILIIPAVITAITGTFVFSYAHTFADKITKQQQIRDWKLLLPKSILLTGVYLCLLIIFPEQNILAPIVTIVMHSLNNFVATKLMKTSFLTVQQNSSSQDNVLDVEINKIIETFNDISKKSSVPDIDQNLIDEFIKNIDGITKYGSYTDELKEIKENLKNLPENKDERYKYISEQINNLFIIFLKSNSNYQKYTDSLFKYLTPLTPYIYDQESGKLLFDLLLEILLDERQGLKDKKYDILSAAGDMLECFLDDGKEQYCSKIISRLFEKNLILKDEDIPFSIKSVLLKNGYDGLKLYFSVIAEDEPRDEKLYEILGISINSFVKDIESKNLPNKQEIIEILEEIESLKQNISKTRLPLLENRLKILSDKIFELNQIEQYEELSYKLLIDIFPILNMLVDENKSLNDKIITTIYKILKKSFKFKNNEYFNIIFSNLLSFAKLTEDLKRNSVNEKSVSCLTDIALEIYSPVEKGLLEENSEEYKYRKAFTLELFSRMAKALPFNSKIYSEMFNYKSMVIRRYQGIGLTPETFKIFLDAVKTGGKRKVSIELPEDEYIHDVDKLIEMFKSAEDHIDFSTLIKNSFKKEDSYYTLRNRNVKDKQIAKEIFIYLFDIANNSDNKLEKRLAAINQLMTIALNGIYKSNNEELPIDIYDIKRLARELNFPKYVLLGAARFENDSNGREGRLGYNYTPLLRFIPRHIIEENPFYEYEWRQSADFENAAPITTEIKGKTDFSKPEVKDILLRFQLLQDILEYNVFALQMLDNLKDDEDFQKNFKELIDILTEMANKLLGIDKEHGSAALSAINEIYTEEINLWNQIDFNRRNEIKKHISLLKWTLESLKDIKEVHTLINAIHQISIADFKQEIGDLKNISSVQTIHSSQVSNITAYNLSDNKVNANIVKFITALSKIKFTHDIDDFICKDDMLIWTTRLNAHSVDIFFNFGNVDRGISIFYRERPVGFKDEGKLERIRYFSTVLNILGFNVNSDIQYSGTDQSYGLKAVMNKDFGLNDTVDLIDIAVRVVELFKFSTNIDYDLKHRYYQHNYEQEVFRKLIDKFMRGEMWYGIDINNDSLFGRYCGYGNNGMNLVSLPNRKILNKESLNAVLSYLGLSDLISDEGKLDDQKKLDKYFNDVIETAFIEGRIFIDENGILQKGHDNILSSLQKDILSDEDEALKQSRILNLINRYEFKSKIIGYVGDFVAATYIMELTNGDKLFIKAIMDPKTKRIKFASTEIVSDISREKITSENLLKILSTQGYDLEIQEWINETERERIEQSLYRRVQMIDTPEMRGLPTSSGNGTYVAGYITFNKNNVDRNSIFVAPYTTPDDVERIKTAKAIITTGGGVLSHAAITTREYKTPSVIINGANWNENELDILYYSPAGEPFDVDALSMRKIEGQNKNLKEGSIVLLNGDTGHILLFDDIDEDVLKDLQKCIEKDDASGIKNILIDNADNENIKKLVEYVYFQTIGDSRMPNTLDMLFSSDMPQVIKNKIKELNEGYIQDKIRNINEAIENLEAVDNPNIAYSILQTLIDKLEFIKTPEQRQEMDMLKEEVVERTKKVKDNLFSFLSDLVKECEILIAKEKLTQKDMNRIFNIIQQANVYNMFVAENETNVKLKNIKRQIKQNIEKLEIKIKKYIELQNVMEKQILSLDDIDSNDVYSFGSKTTELAKIKKVLKEKKNVVVPEGVGVSCNVFDLFFEIIGQKEKSMILLSSFEQAIKDGDLQLAQDYAEQIKKLIEIGRKELESTDGLRTELEETVLRTLGNTNYSVRSSGVGEDSANNAFAGMGETVLNVSKDNLFDSLITCWESFYSKKSIKYMINSKQIVRPAVLIQTMIDVEKSGVVFSRDKYGNVTIETLYGLGEGIVSGKITPDTITVNMANGDVLEYSVATKDYKIVSVEDGIKTTFVKKGSKERTLKYKEIKELIDVVKLLEKDAGYAVDIEFGFKDGKIYILQRRPITTANNNNISKQENIKCNIQLSFAPVQEDQKVFVNIANPENEEESIPVYFKMDKTADGYTYSYIVDSKYASMSDSIQEILFVRSNEDSVIRDKISSCLSIFAQAKEGKIEILPPLSDTIDTSEIEQNINMNMEGIRNLLASA